MRFGFSFIVLVILFCTGCGALQALKRHVSDEPAPKTAKKKSKRSPSSVATFSSGSQAMVGPRRTPWDSIRDDRIGSLWNDQGQDNFYFSKNVKRRVGDIFVLKAGADINNLLNAKFENYYARLAKQSAAKNSKTPEPVENKPPEEDEEINVAIGEVSMKLERELPRGAFEAIGEKTVYVRNTRFVVSVTGTVKMEDILPDDSLLSTRLLDSKVVLKK